MVASPMDKLFQRCVTAALVLITCARVQAGARGTPLDDYVRNPDPQYRWYDTGKRLTGFLPWEKWEGHVINMTSQAWLSSEEVDCSIWSHNLVVVKPGNYKYKKTALLIIGDGNSNDAPSAADELMILAATVAVKTGSLAVVLYQVPNQPCSFTSEHPRRERREDELIAYTWSYFLDHPDQNDWPLRLPMTKAVVRAMDTVQTYAADVLSTLIEKFVVAGASKRGWTTWTTAAVDDRVVGIIPIVMDSLNMVRNLHHFYQSLGGWPYSFKAYYDMNITSRLDSAEFSKLMDIVDPWVYRDRLSVPKLMVTTSNDEFFLLDDSRFFWDDLPGEKHILILSNTEHSLITGLLKLLTAVEAFFLSIVEGHESSQMTLSSNSALQTSLQLPGQGGLQERRPGFGGRPQYSWHINRDSGRIEIGTTERPLKVLLWYAYTTDGIKGRDFRWFILDRGQCPTVAVKNICIQPVYFRSRTLRPSGLSARTPGKKNYYASISVPKNGYGAFYVELRFEGPSPLRPFIFTTAAVIVPNYYPFEDCYGVQCRGHLV